MRDGFTIHYVFPGLNHSDGTPIKHMSIPCCSCRPRVGEHFYGSTLGGRRFVVNSVSLDPCDGFVTVLLSEVFKDE